MKNNRIAALLLATCFFIMFSNKTFSQIKTKTEKLDSLQKSFAQDSAHLYRWQKVRPFVGIDTRNSWIKSEGNSKLVPVNLNGGQLGVILGEKHTIGLGGYDITSSSKQPKQIKDRNNLVKYQNLNIAYATVFYQYTIVDTRFFELDLPLEIGVGGYKYYLTDSVNNKVIPKSTETGAIKLTGGGVQIVLKPFKWIGISGLAGYRIVSLNKHTNLNLNGPYLSYGVWVDVRQIIRDYKFYFVKRKKYRQQVKEINSRP